MLVDKSKEEMPITEIVKGLSEIERHAFGKVRDSSAKFGLLAFRVACQTYQLHRNSVLPTLYDSSGIRDCLLYMSAAMDLVRCFNSLPNKNFIKKARKHLQLVGSGSFGIAATYFNQQKNPSRLEALLSTFVKPLPKEQQLDASRKTIELMIGLACMTKFDNVHLKRPSLDSAIHWPFGCAV